MLPRNCYDWAVLPGHGVARNLGVAVPTKKPYSFTPGKLAMWLFLASDAMGFMGFLGVYMVLRVAAPLRVENLTGEQIGGNTGYIIHPEEIMSAALATAIALLFLLFPPMKIIALICIGALIIAFPVSSIGTLIVLDSACYLIYRSKK